jgi:hypothetical protein
MMTISRLIIRLFFPYSSHHLFSRSCVVLYKVTSLSILTALACMAYLVNRHVSVYLLEPNKTAAKQTTWRAYCTRVVMPVMLRSCALVHFVLFDPCYKKAA